MENIQLTKKDIENPIHKNIGLENVKLVKNSSKKERNNQKVINKLNDYVFEIQSKNGNPNAKKKIIMRLKFEFPNLNLNKFFTQFVQKNNNISSFENETLQVINNYNDNHFSLRRKKMQGKTKTERKEIRKTDRKKFITNAKKTFASSFLAPLFPLKGLMVNAIWKKTGKNLKSSKLIDIVATFYKDVVQGKTPITNNFYETDKYQDFNTFQKVYGSDAQDHLVTSELVDIVNQIIKYFKKIKDNKLKGVNQVSSENDLAIGLINKETEILEKAENEKFGMSKSGEETTEEKKSNTKILIIGAIAAYFLLK